MIIKLSIIVDYLIKIYIKNSLIFISRAILFPLIMLKQLR